MPQRGGGVIRERGLITKTKFQTGGLLEREVNRGGRGLNAAFMVLLLWSLKFQSSPCPNLPEECQDEEIADSSD